MVLNKGNTYFVPKVTRTKMIIRFHQRTARLSCAASKSENKGRCFGRFEVLMNSRKAAWSSSVRTKPFVQAHLPCHSPSTSTVGKA